MAAAESELHRAEQAAAAVSELVPAERVRLRSRTVGAEITTQLVQARADAKAARRARRDAIAVQLPGHRTVKGHRQVGLSKRPSGHGQRIDGIRFASFAGRYPASRDEMRRAAHNSSRARGKQFAFQNTCYRSICPRQPR